MNIHFSYQALESLEDILYFLKFKQGLPPNQVTKVKNVILHGIKGLRTHPQMGQEEPLLAHYKKGYRRIIIGHAKVIYRIDQDSIRITDIFDSRRSPDSMKQG